MSSLKAAEKQYLERLLRMENGYVLNYTSSTFPGVFAQHKVNILEERYQIYGQSKAKTMRAFWEQDSDSIVAPILMEFLDAYEAECDLNDRVIDGELLEKCRLIVSRLSGEAPSEANKAVESFLDKEFTIPDIHKLPVEPQIATIIEARLNEARAALSAKAYLSVIFLCGSVLEGVLFGVARKHPEKFNRSQDSAKDKEGKVRPFGEWSLAQFIEVACNVKLLDLDVKEFSHGLRDFRNYIHPYKQMKSGFIPDEHTAKVCFQVLKAALASVTGERRRSIESEDLSDVGRSQLEYWTKMVKCIQEQSSLLQTSQTPRPQKWFEFPIGRKGFILTAEMQKQQQRIRAALYIQGPKAKLFFDLLQEQKEDIDKALGYRLNWEVLPRKQRADIAVYLENIDPYNQDEWPKQHNWLVDHLNGLHKVFASRIKDLKADDGRPDDDDDGEETTD